MEYDPEEVDYDPEEYDPERKEEPEEIEDEIKEDPQSEDGYEQDRETDDESEEESVEASPPRRLVFRDTATGSRNRRRALRNKIRRDLATKPARHRLGGGVAGRTHRRARTPSITELMSEENEVTPFNHQKVSPRSTAILHSIYVSRNYAVYLYVCLSNPIRLLTRIKTPCNRDDSHCGTTQRCFVSVLSHLT